MGYGTRAALDPVRELGFGSVSGSYTAVGTPLSDHIRIISLNNGLDESIYVSLDGVVDHFRMSPNSFKLFDLSANKIRDDGLFLPVGKQIYIKEVSASVTAGTFWTEVIYAEGGK